MDRDDLRKAWIWRTIGIAVIAIAAVGIIAFMWTENRAAQERQNANEAMERELRPLEVERHRLQQELETVKTDYRRESQGTGSLVLLFTDMDEQIYTEVYPQMEEAGFRGVLTLSKDSFPGAAGCMSKKQFRELTDAGWECCLKWDADADIADWAAEGGRLSRAAGIALPETVYFGAETYDSAEDPVLLKKEFLTVVHHGEEKLPLITSEIGDGIWHVGAMPWGQRDAQQMAQEVMAQKGSLVFTAGHDSEEEEYDEARYASMLGYIQSCCEDGDLKVMTLSEAREYWKEIADGREVLTDDYNGRRADLETRIEELEQQIDEITEKYSIKP